MKILSKTVRCEGVGIDPLDKDKEKLQLALLINDILIFLIHALRHSSRAAVR